MTGVNQNPPLGVQNIGSLMVVSSEARCAALRWGFEMDRIRTELQSLTHESSMRC